MNKFIKEYFYIAEDDEIREKVMLTRIGLSITFILICLAAMTISAYGYFSSENGTSYMVISSANYEIDVETSSDAVGPTAGVYTLVNETDAPKEFVFTVSRRVTPTAASVGYCKIKVKTDANDMSNYDDVQVFYTEPIGKFVKNGLETDQQSREITVVVEPHQTAMITFVAQYGSCSREVIEGNRVEPVFATATKTVVGEDEYIGTEPTEEPNEEPTEESEKETLPDSDPALLPENTDEEQVTE